MTLDKVELLIENKRLKELFQTMREDRNRYYKKVKQQAKEIFEDIKKEFYSLECADEIKTSQGMKCPWTPIGVGLSKAYNLIIQKLKTKWCKK